MPWIVFATRNAKHWVISGLLIVCPLQWADADDSVSHAIAAAREFQSVNQPKIVREFADLLSLRNVASNREDMKRNAAFILDMMHRRGIKTRLLEAPGSPPAIFGELDKGAGHTVLIYAHYDGQPVQRELWATDPWQPTLRSGTFENNAPVVGFDQLPDHIPG